MLSVGSHRVGHDWSDLAAAAAATTPKLWPPDAKSWLIRNDPDAGKDRTQAEKGMTEDEMVGWHYRFNGHDSVQAPRAGDGQGSLACCSPLGLKESDTTEPLNWAKSFPQVALLVKILLANAGDLGSIPASGRSPRGRHGTPLQCSWLENPMDRGAWRATVHRLQRVGHDWSNLAHMHAHILEGWF